MDYVNPRSKPLPVLEAEATEAPDPDRRAFISEAARLAALTVLVSACSGGLGSVTGPGSSTLSKAITVKLSDYPGLANPVSAVRINGTNIPLALVNEGNGQYTALSLICTHQGGTVQWNGQIFICPVHGAEFASDGHWIGGQPTTNLVSFPTSYDAAANTVTISP
ncbi:MAG: Rieske 2Fe-2S domain-containing protein [Gemmatimonadetes bacterium]|nr:Rieske 2Fe-2S domain-containing protein [Gemmatimonadota bacterium]